MLGEIARLEGVMLLLVLCGVVLNRKGVITQAGQDCLTDLLMLAVLFSLGFLWGRRRR